LTSILYMTESKFKGFCSWRRILSGSQLLEPEVLQTGSASSISYH